MAQAPLILLTNDDGIHAEGLQALEAVISQSWDVHVVAPATVMSQCGHRITTEEPLEVTAHGDNRHAVSGTPADCVRLALTQLLPRRPDWVLSGINHGGNLGADLYVSGTVAAVREGAYLGLPGIALSHYKKRELEFDWEWAARCALNVVEKLMDTPLAEKEHWNVNLPHIPPQSSLPKHVQCEPSQHPLPVSFEEKSEGPAEVRRFHYNGVYQDRQREPHSDIDVCFGGRIAISKLSL